MSYYEAAKAVVMMARRRLAIASDYHTVYGTPEGERMIHDILREAGLLSVGHVAGDPGSSTFADGKRAVGLAVIQRLRWSEGELVKLARQQTAAELDDGEG
jgi:hypothetical protein